MIKAVLFDVDNTLIDFMAMKRKASNAAAIAMVRTGLQMDVKLAEKKLFDTYIKNIEGEHAFEDFLHEHKAYNDRRLAAALNAYLTVKYKHMKPYSGVKETLTRLQKRGIKLGIVTDAPRIKAFQRLDAMGIADYFEFVVGFEDTHKHKPDSAPFFKALLGVKCKASETLFVGDWQERDMLGAKKVGMKTCWAKYGGNRLGRKIRSDYVAKTFRDITKIVTEV